MRVKNRMLFSRMALIAAEMMITRRLLHIHHAHGSRGVRTYVLCYRQIRKSMAGIAHYAN